VSERSPLASAFVAELDAAALGLLAEKISPYLVRHERRDAIGYTVEALASEIGLTARAVRGAIGRGELAAVKRGRHYLIAASAVEAWLAPGWDVAATRPTARPKGKPRDVMRSAVARLDTTRYSVRHSTKRPGGARTPRGRQQEAKS
jgi:excisionase family DNA binding protein